MKKKFQGHVYSSSAFSWNIEAKTFTANIKHVPKVLRTLSTEDMTLGFGIKSERTGSIVNFVLNAIERDSEGKIASWTFVPDESHNQKGLQGVTVKVLA